MALGFFVLLEEKQLAFLLGGGELEHVAFVMSQKRLGTHLFFNCRFASMVWSLIHLAFDISKPSNVSNMFRSWSGGFGKDLTPRLATGIEFHSNNSNLGIYQLS
jgi:hypothetical protein